MSGSWDAMIRATDSARRPLSPAELADLVGLAAAAAAANRAATLEQLSELLGAQLQVNDYGAVELTSAQASQLLELLPARPLELQLQGGVDGVTADLAGLPIWVTD